MIGNPDELRYEGGCPMGESNRKFHDRLDLKQAGPDFVESPPKTSATTWPWRGARRRVQVHICTAANA